MTKKKLLLYSALILLFTSCKKEFGNNNTENASKLKIDLQTLKSGVVVQKKGNQYIWQGDIVLSALQLKTLNETGNIFGDNVGDPDRSVHPTTNIADVPINSAVGIFPTAYNTWAMVRYVLNPALTGDRLSIINYAIAAWETSTNVRFYNATGQSNTGPGGITLPYVEFVNGSVNSSSIGRIGGRQEIKLAQNQPIYAAVHEIGHAIGLMHEQCRYDRDSYINLNLSNVAAGDQFNFTIVTAINQYTTIGSFDFSSIMLYGSTDFAINPAIPVMTRKNGTTWTQSQVLSSLDRSWANNYYLPYKARTDSYKELANVVYKPDNTVMTAAERLALQASLNGGISTPPNEP